MTAFNCVNCGPIPLDQCRRVTGRGLRCLACEKASRDRYRSTGTTPATKVCSGCGAELPASAFHRMFRGSTRLRSRCKPCYRQRVNEARRKAS